MTAPEPFSIELLASPDGLVEIATAWDALASATPTPFATSAWLVAWWRSSRRHTRCILLRDSAGNLRAGAVVHSLPGRGVRGAADVHSGDWGVVAADPVARDAAWKRVAALAGPVRRLVLPALDDIAVDAARSALEPIGFHFVEIGRLDSPAMALPSSREQLLSTRSRNLRSQVARSRRAMQRHGELALRAGGQQRTLEDDLERFLQLEASGWKGRQGTAILTSARTAALYRDFAAAAFSEGSLRLVLLELDGALVAADLSCRIGPRTSLIKTAYDERLAALRPGLVLRAEALLAAIDDGSSEYDFLGGPDEYKLRWASELRPRRDMLAVSGGWRLEAGYRRKVRPRLGQLRRRLRLVGPTRLRAS